MFIPSVAVIKSDFHGHSGSWNTEWLKICAEEGIPHELVDWRKRNAFDMLLKHNVILWHYSHYSNEEMKFAPSILKALKESGCAVFPSETESYHFDDKVAQAYLLNGLGLPTPKNYPLHSPNAVKEWIDNISNFPIVAKLRAGSGSNNVTLIKNKNELKQYSKRMFRKGINSQPSTFFKIKSNAASSRSLTQAIARLKRAPEFFFTRNKATDRGRERNYVYLQEFIKDVNYDLKIAVIGDQLSFIGRNVRKGDFRASGGGDLFYTRELITPELIETAFRSADRLGSDCMGFDMILDPLTSKPLILELSYGFSHTALMAAGGYYDRKGIWYNEPLNAPKAVLHRMLSKAATSSF